MIENQSFVCYLFTLCPLWLILFLINFMINHYYTSWLYYLIKHSCAVGT